MSLEKETVWRRMGMAALILASFAVGGTGLVVFTHLQTAGAIAAAQHMALEAQLNAIIPVDRYDNAIVDDRIIVTVPEKLGIRTPVIIYRARKGGQPVALCAVWTAPDGYSGPIQLLMGVYVDGTIAGIRTISHKETPGLGDALEEKRSGWILGFTGRSLGNPPAAQWKVKKDGGTFDQFTGATITPRAVVKATRLFLEYVQAHRDALFAR